MVPPQKALFWQRLGSHAVLRRARPDRGPAAPDSSQQQPSSSSLYSQYTRALGASGTTSSVPQHS